MLKIIIADDERVTRETISSLINWNEYGIELSGLCSNGIEAYDMILDVSPDIVITDIRMPGISGLELIGRISQTDLDTQFILLSGYGEFEYAKEAMQYGVRHYLLKPINEQQIIDAVQKSVQDCYEKQQTRQVKDSQFLPANHMRHNVISSIINDSLYLEKPLEEIIRTYEPYMDFHFTPYRLFYLHFLEQDNLEWFLGKLREYWVQHLSQVSIYGVYVKNTYLMFCRDHTFNDEKLMSFLGGLRLAGQSVSQELRSETYPDLQKLLTVILEKIRRYSVFYYINNFHALCTCNYTATTQEMEALYHSYNDGSPQAGEQLRELFSDVTDIRFLRQLASSLFLKLTLNNPNLSSTALTDWLVRAEKLDDMTALKDTVLEKLDELLSCLPNSGSPSNMTQQICGYVEEHLENPNLTLKFIAEQYLYMNVDYVSRKFQKETGIRFSNYLADTRIKKAREYIETNRTDRIQDIAERVGFGNNPQYFSQLFKKKTGMTPSTYITSLNGRSSRREKEE